MEIEALCQGVPCPELAFDQEAALELKGRGAVL
jgi:hypothetical protein